MKDIKKLQVIGFSLLLGGILGNFIDRVFYGYVIDYLDFYILGGVIFDYPDEVEICKDVKRKIKRNLFVKYLSKETIN